MQRKSLSLRQTLILGASLGILIPAIVFAVSQISGKFEREIDLRVRAPMRQYADMLASGVSVAIWNVDRSVAVELIDAVMRNPDVTSISVNNEYGRQFVAQQRSAPPDGAVSREERNIYYNGTLVGQLALQFTSVRVEHELWADLAKLAAALAAQVVISFIAILMLFDRRMMRPLQSLQESARRLARGDLKQPLRWRRTDEIGSLAQDLDAMRVDLASLITERDQKNAALQVELTERHRAEDALTVSQAKFAAIFESSPVAMTVSHLGDEVVVMDANNAWTQLFVRGKALVVGTPVETDVMWRSPDDWHGILDEVRRSGQIVQRKAWLQRGAGLADILCSLSGKRVDLGAESLLILAYEDITAKQQYEENILHLNASLEARVSERTLELEKALQQLTAAQSELVRSEKMSALGSLVAGVAHELNTPIGNSLTVASTLQHHCTTFSEEMSQALTRRQLENFVNQTRTGTEILMRGLGHAAELVASFKQVAVDQASENRRKFKLSEAIGEILMVLGVSIRTSTHSVKVAIPEEICMESYPGPLGQVLTNLVNNALLHAFDGRRNGIISVSAMRDGDEWVQVEVADDGVGIPDAIQSRIFDPFFTTKLGQGGSGLGLSITYNIVTNLLGGAIAVKDNPGGGTVFTLYLPRQAPLGAQEGSLAEQLERSGAL